MYMNIELYTYTCGSLLEPLVLEGADVSSVPCFVLCFLFASLIGAVVIGTVVVGAVVVGAIKVDVVVVGTIVFGAPVVGAGGSTCSSGYSSSSSGSTVYV
jgi:hypothetical protein